MELKLVKVLNIIGNLALINIDGQKLKAKVEGNIPSNVFLGEVRKENGKVIIRAQNDLSLIKDLDRILLQLEVSKTPKNYLLTKTLMALDIPITKENLETIKRFNLPYLISGLVLKSKEKSHKKHMSLTETLFNEIPKKISENEFCLFINSLFTKRDRELFGILHFEEERESWYSYIEFNESGFKKIVLTTRIEEVEIIILLERISKGYNLSINFFSEREIRVVGEEKLKQNLEALGFNPINIDIESYGGRE
ncbi:MAG: hypothetical protein ABDH28_01420 [Brevinematia bacterium]